MTLGKGCHYGKWYNNIRLNSFFPPQKNGQREQPEEGEEMPTLFEGNENGKDGWLKWMLSDTKVDIGLVSGPLQSVAERAGIGIKKSFSLPF